MGLVSRESRLQVPKNTYIASYDDALIVSGVFGTKTIRGDHAPVAKRIIAGCDGKTPLSEIINETNGTAQAVAEALCKDGILYPASQISPIDPSDRYRGLFESILLSLKPNDRQTFAEDILSQAIAIKGDGAITKQLASTFRSVGWTVDGTQTSEKMDMLLFLETAATTNQRRIVNEAWLNSDVPLLRIASESDVVEVGPLLSPTANVCLECLTTREKINGSGEDLTYEKINPGPSYNVAAAEDLILGITARIMVGHLPPELDGVIRRIDMRTLEQHESHLLGIPGCEYCGF
jgi:hypothetical protein